MKYLFVSAGSQAAVFAITPLAHAARNAGHQVIVTANEAMTASIVDVGLPAVSVTSLPLKDFVTMDRAGRQVTIPMADPVAEARFTGEWFARLAAGSLAALRDLARDWRPDVVVGGGMSYAAGLLAAELGVPYVRQSIDTTEVTGIDQGAAGELAPELTELGLAGLPAADLFVDICPPSLRFGDAADRLSMRWVPGNRQRLLERWMYTRGERPRVCVTLGSRVALMHNVATLSQLVGTLSALDAELLVAAPDDAATTLRAEHPGVLAGWIPLDVVAPTCDLVVHHGGGVTTMTALDAAVPQLIMPAGWYATSAAQRVADCGAAVVRTDGECSAAEIASAASVLLAEPHYRKRAEALAEEIAAAPPPSETVAAIDLTIAKHN
jgi:glycosyltransferase